jgi:hypothetical protein
MTITRRIAATAMLAGLAVGVASTAWADTTMSGHYIKTVTSGSADTENWYFTPCGDGCASVAMTSGGQPFGQARLVNGQWTLDATDASTPCDDGSSVPNSQSQHWTWVQNSLAGTELDTLTVAACGQPVGFKWTANIQLKQAPSSAP